MSVYQRLGLLVNPMKQKKRQKNAPAFAGAFLISFFKKVNESGKLSFPSSS